MAEGVATYKHDYWSKRNRLHQTVNTWKGYLRTMLKVPQKGPLNAEFLLQAIVAKPKPNMNGSAIRGTYGRLLSEQGFRDKDVLFAQDLKQLQASMTLPLFSLI